MGVIHLWNILKWARWQPIALRYIFYAEHIIYDKAIAASWSNVGTGEIMRKNQVRHLFLNMYFHSTLL